MDNLSSNSKIMNLERIIGNDEMLTYALDWYNESSHLVSQKIEQGITVEPNQEPINNSTLQIFEFIQDDEINTDTSNKLINLDHCSDVHEEMLQEHIYEDIHTGINIFEDNTIDTNMKIKNENTNVLTYDKNEVQLFETSRHYCTLCEKSYSRKSRLTEHYRSHNKEFSCSLCDKNFSSKRSLRRHNVRYHKFADKKKYFCSICNRSFLRKSFLVSHIRGHGEIGLFKCDLCPKKYKYRHNLNTHKKIHDKRFQCEGCKKWFSTKSSWFRHLKRFPICSIIEDEITVEPIQKPVDVNAMLNFKSAKENEKDKKLINRSIHLDHCSDVHEEMLQEHIYEDIHTGINIFGDNTIDTNMKKKNENTNSLTFDKNEVQFKTSRHYCTLCEKSYSRKSGLAEHYRSHNKEFFCPLCEKNFSAKKWLHRHNVSYHKFADKKNYFCSICNSSFLSKSFLISHKKGHVEREPFKCDLCPKKYKYRRNLISHKKIHDKRFQCESCKKWFTTKPNRSRHLKRFSTCSIIGEEITVEPIQNRLTLMQC